MLRIKLIIKYCVSCWITDVLQNDTRSIQYEIFPTIVDTCLLHLKQSKVHSLIRQVGRYRPIIIHFVC